jgi:hypothetical protein
MSNIVNLPTPDERAGSRLHLMRTISPALFDLPENMGTPNEWLHTAMQCISLEDQGTGWDDGVAVVSKAAISLVIMKLEELLFNGPEISIRPID